MRDLPESERLNSCKKIIMFEKDESMRWDAVWLVGEIASNALSKNNKELFGETVDLMAWVLKNDNNGVVKHEACYQIAARNMRENIPELISASLQDDSVLTRHEALESLGLMRAVDTIDVINDALNDPSLDVRETAHFVLKRLRRMKKLGSYNPSSVP
ncbi:MAG: HEAT repeat domain-containing protein [Nitrosopumilus sp.]|nr:HEAT repeat domain-containing protein [Nitrosopumilus sp.]MDH3487647.1 HEAT repeat domain-containing protein [Nitrosopumilus sp.]